MYLLLSIILSAILGLVLLMLDPLIGGVLAFGIVAGCIFRGLFLIKDIHKSIVPKKNKVQDAYDSYIEERDKTSWVITRGLVKVSYGAIEIIVNKDGQQAPQECGAWVF